MKVLFQRHIKYFASGLENPDSKNLKPVIPLHHSMFSSCSGQLSPDMLTKTFLLKLEPQRYYLLFLNQRSAENLPVK